MTTLEAKAELERSNHGECPFCGKTLKGSKSTRPLPDTVMHKNDFANVYETRCTNPDCDAPHSPFVEFFQISD